MLYTHVTITHTATTDNNQTTFAQGIETSDIQNHSNYDGKAIAAGITIGKTKESNPDPNLNGIGYGSDGDSQSSITKAAVTGMAGQSNVTTATKDSLNEPLVNSFDASTVLQELNAQVHITRDFRNESFKAINDYTHTRQADLRQKIKNLDANASLEDKKAIYDEIGYNIKNV